MTKQYYNYLVGLKSQFDPGYYTAVVDEISLINEKTGATPVDFKAEIIISFLKDHSLQTDWIDVNPELSKLVTSQTLFTGSIESLFIACHDNPGFRYGLEDYLKEGLTGNGHPDTAPK